MRKILLILSVAFTLCLTLCAQTRLVVNTGATANDGTGDSARTSFNKVNTNFATLWAVVYTNGIGATNAFRFSTNAFVTSGTNISLNHTITITNKLTIDGDLSHDMELRDIAQLTLDSTDAGLYGVASLFLDGGVTTLRGVTNLQVITPAVYAGTATVGQVLKLSDATEGTVEFAAESAGVSTNANLELLSRYQPGISQRVAANPPVVSMSLTSTIPSATLIGPGNPGIRVLNTTPRVAPSGAYRQRLASLINSGYPASEGENYTHGWAVEWATTAEDMEFQLGGRIHGFRISVNDEMVTPFGFYNEGLAYGVADAGGTTFCRMRFGERSAPTEPTWPTRYLRTVQDDRIRWMATDIATSTYVINESTWTGASGTTPPTGWSVFDTPTFTVGTHDSVTTALNMVTTNVQQNLRRLGVTTVGTNYVLKFRAKVISGSFQWMSSTGFYTISTANSARWTTHYVPFVAAATELYINNFSLAGEVWLDDVQLYDPTAAPAVTAWAANTTYRRSDTVSPSTYNGFHYQAVVVRPEMKRVTVELSGYLEFGGVSFGSGGSLANPGRQRKPVCAIIGDSYSIGANSVIPNAPTHNSVLADFASWPLIMCRELGWDARVNGSGGSGYMANGNGGKFSLRIQELIDLSPDVFVFAGGYNDGASATADIANEFATLVSQVRTALPSCVILSVGPWAPEISATHPTLTRIRINKALRDKAEELGIPYIAPIEWPVVTGEWAVAGSGNAPEFITANNIHPTIFGYEAIGRWIASQVAVKLSGRAQAENALQVLNAPTPSWSTFGTVVTSTVTHDGVTNALQVTVANTTGHNIYTTPMLASHVAYNARKIRTRLKVKVASGSVKLGTDTPTITGRFSHPFRVRSRPLNGMWTDLSIPTLTVSSDLYLPFTTANAGTWTEYEIESAWSNRIISLYSQSTADPQTVYYVKDVTVDVLSE